MLTGHSAYLLSAAKNPTLSVMLGCEQLCPLWCVASSPVVCESLLFVVDAILSSLVAHLGTTLQVT